MRVKKKLEDDIADEIDLLDKIEDVKTYSSNRFDMLADRFDAIERAEDAKRWRGEEQKQNLLFALQAGCWIILIVTAAVLLIRNLKKAKYELS